MLLWRKSDLYSWTCFLTSRSSVYFVSFFRPKLSPYFSILCFPARSGGTVPTLHHQTTSMTSIPTPRPRLSTWQSSSHQPAPTTSSTSTWPPRRACWPWDSSGVCHWCTHYSLCPKDCMNRCSALSYEPPWLCSTPWSQVICTVYCLNVTFTCFFFF